MRKYVLGFAFLLAIVIPSATNALSGSEFQPGRIIDDGIFYNKDSMNIDQIQHFLNGKVSCDTNGTKPYGGGTRAQYGSANGNPPPYTCLNNYHENTATGDNNLQGRSIPAGAKSAAVIIYEAAQTYNISPQVLITLIQREQGLVTDEWPFLSQYRSATGYACPDSGPNHSANCNGYPGFFRQVDAAAWQLKRYRTNPNEYNFIAGQNNTIQWNPQPSCGTSVVYIQNQATAALYNYTPYRPNDSALNNLYGTGDSCGAYGNRNFWRYFRDWFGGVFADPFMWTATNLFIMDETKSANISTDYLKKGERLFVVVKGVNMGTEIWYRDGVNPARLGTWNPRDKRSEFCDTSWLGMSSFCNRSARLVEEMVRPGETFHFETYIHAPNQGGEFREWFKPVLEGRAWMTNETNFHLYLNSTNFYDWRWMYFGAWTDSSKTTAANMDSLYKNQEVYIELKVKNNSATIWRNSGDNPTRLGMQNPHDHNSFLCTPSWISCNRAATLIESEVYPGQLGTFGFTIKVPGTIGEYREYMKPVIEFKGWMRGDNNHIYMNVTH